MQNDFTDPDGSLYVPGAEAIVPVINAEIDTATAVGAPVSSTPRTGIRPRTIYQARALGVLGGPAADARAIIRGVVDPLAYGVHGDEAAWRRAGRDRAQCSQHPVVRRTLFLLPCRTRRRVAPHAPAIE